jgi:hypothetical protein
LLLVLISTELLQEYLNFDPAPYIGQRVLKINNQDPVPYLLVRYMYPIIDNGISEKDFFKPRSGSNPRTVALLFRGTYYINFITELRTNIRWLVQRRQCPRKQIIPRRSRLGFDRWHENSSPRLPDGKFNAVLGQRRNFADSSDARCLPRRIF